MVETIITEVDPQQPNELQQIMDHIHSGNHFLLSGGAGSGKTYTLVEVIKQVIEGFPTAKIACMTYTNAAVKEIEERVDNKHLSVTTIHDFLWDNIKSFQKELKSSLVTLINSETIRFSDSIPIPEDYFDHFEQGIQYREYLKLRSGIISHDEVLTLAHHLFSTYPKLSDIIKDKYKFIFIDEYQDTQEKVVQIFLDHLSQSPKSNTLGFFGDAMQSIYDDGIGDLNHYVGEQDGQVREVQKIQNRRNPKSVIDLANQIRTDGLEQEPSDDMKAPNMSEDGNVKEGNIQFIYSVLEDLPKLRDYLQWDFTDAENTKELNLTHNLIADKASIRILVDIYDKDQILKYKDRIRRFIRDKGVDTDFNENTFGEVIEILSQQFNNDKGLRPTKGMQDFINEHDDLFHKALDIPYAIFSNIYVDKDQLLDDKKQDTEDKNKKGSKRDDLIKHLFKIQHNIFLYNDKQFNEFIRKTEYSIRTIQDKIDLKNIIEELTNVGEATIEEIISKADEHDICKIDDKLDIFKQEKGYVYDRIKEVQFTEFQELYKYLEGFTPFSTQHKTKGTEFDNVLVVLDNGNWRFYDFKALFTGDAKETVLERSQKIFYVCCTRAKENLAVYYQSPPPEVIAKARQWFGEDQVVNLDEV